MTTVGELRADVQKCLAAKYQSIAGTSGATVMVDGKLVTVQVAEHELGTEGGRSTTITTVVNVAERLPPSENLYRFFALEVPPSAIGYFKIRPGNEGTVNVVLVMSYLADTVDCGRLLEQLRLMAAMAVETNRDIATIR